MWPLDVHGGLLMPFDTPKGDKGHSTSNAFRMFQELRLGLDLRTRETPIVVPQKTQHDRTGLN